MINEISRSTLRQQFDSPRVNVFTRAQVQAILQSKTRANLFKDPLLEYLDPALAYDNILQVQEQKQVVKPDLRRLQFTLDRIKSPLFKTDPWVWKALIRLKKYLQTGELYDVKIRTGPVRHLRFTDIKQLGGTVDIHVAVKGVIKRVTTTVSAVTYTQYACKDCGGITPCSTLWYQKLPIVSCERCKSRKLSQQHQKRQVESWQNILVYPLNTSQYLHSLRLRIHDAQDFDAYTPGEQVVCQGILKCIYKDNAMTELYLDAEEILPLDTKKRKPTARDAATNEAYLVSLGSSYWAALKKLVFPRLFGLQLAKDASLLQLFGGWKKLSRDNIHILLVGNPSTGKSALMRRLHTISGGSFVSGMGATSAGLTATAYKDDVGAWCLDGGALVMSQSKSVYFDELDKISKEGQNALLQAMQQQTVSVAKAGINIVLPAKCRILAACNPTIGSKFDQDRPYLQQLGLTAPLLSRFDLVIAMGCDQGTDAEVLQSFLNGADQQEPANLDALCSYIEYARGFEPVLGEQLKEVICQFYVQTKKTYADTPDLPFSIRQFQGMVRLATAKAKSRLSPRVQIEDWEFVKNIAKECYKRLTKRDVGIVHLPPGIGESRLTRGEQQITERILSILTSEGQTSAQRLFSRLASEKANLCRNTFDKCISTLEYIGKIYKPDRMHLSVVGQERTIYREG